MSAPRPGFIHYTAILDSPPEHREYKPGQPVFPPLIEPTAQINAYVTIDSGMKAPTSVGARSFVMAHVHIGHDAHIGDDCELAPGTVIGGHAILEDGVRCGIGALVLPYKRIGRGARIGAGAVVTKDVPEGEVWAGNPAKRPSQPPRGIVWTPLEERGWEEFGVAVQTGRRQ